MHFTIVSCSYAFHNSKCNSDMYSTPNYDFLSPSFYIYKPRQTDSWTDCVMWLPVVGGVTGFELNVWL